MIMPRRAVSVVFALVMMIGFVGCGGDDVVRQQGSIGVAVMFPPRDSVSGASAAKSMPQVTNSVRIQVEALDEETAPWQRERILNRPDNGDVVRTQIDSVPVGPVRVTATCYDGYDAAGSRVGEASSVVTIHADEVTSVTLVTDRLAETVAIHEVPLPDEEPPPSLNFLELEPGGQQQIQAKGWDFDGEETIYVDFSWASDGEGIGIDPTAGSVVTITAIQDGEYQATVTDANSGQDATIDVDVISRPVASVYLEPRETTLYLFGEPDHVQLTATARDETDEEVAYAELGFMSDNPEIAAVDANGLVTAQSPGQCTITATGATATGSAQATCQITVIESGRIEVIVE